MLVGRTKETAELARLLAEDRAAVVVGEAGVGKTALLRAVAASSGRRVAEGGALATLSWMDYLPLRRALGRPVREGDATAVAVDVEAAVGDAVLLLDDLQWADTASLEVIAQIAGRVGLITGLRRGLPGADAVLDRLREAGLVEVHLAPLPEEHSVAVVRAVRPDLRDTAVARVVRRSGGNPLLLRELSATGEPSASLRLAIAARLRGLDAVARDAFAMLALAGRPLKSEHLDEAGVKSLADAELVVVLGTSVHVRHALLGEVLVDQLSDTERVALHARLARVVREPGEAARHHRLAGEPEAALRAALAAVDATSRPGEQASHLAVAAACATGPEADELRLRAARALESAHDWEAMLRTLELIDPGNRRAQAEACLLRARGAWTAGDIVGLRTNLEAGLGLVDHPESDVAVRLRIEQGRLPVFVDVDLERGVAETEAAYELARATGVEVPRAQYLYGTALAVADRPGAAEQLGSAITAARAVGDTSTEFLAANNLASYHESGDDPGAARAVCKEFIERAAGLGLGEWQQAFQATLVTLAFHAGEYEGLLARSEELLETIREKRAWESVMESYCLALVDTGRIDEARRRITAALPQFSADYRGQIQAKWVQAEAELWGGRPAAALEHIEPCLALPEEDPNLEFFHCSRAWARFDLGLDPGEAPPLHPRAMLSAVNPEVHGVGLLHAGDHAQAAHEFTLAAQRWAGFHRRGELRCRWAAGEAMRRSGNVDAAVRALSHVEKTVQELGMLPLLGRIHRSLRAAGVRRSAPRTRNADDLLTGRQRQLLALAGDGLTNAQIAQRLGISRHTVVSQLASCVAKLGATGRSHAAALATAHEN